MIDAFEWAGPGRVLFGAGAAGRLGELAAEFGHKVLVVTGDSQRGQAMAWLEALEVECTALCVRGEPTLAVADEGAALAKAAGCEWVLAVGGGSVVDAGKAIAALAANAGEALDYVEVIGRGCALGREPLPFVAVPTTAGTGAEATRNAVLGCPEQGVKVSLRHRAMLPRVALVDPQLSVTVPPPTTATTGMDALTQLLEAYVCTRANPLTDALCAQGVVLAARSLRRAVEHGGDLAARADMALAALLSGMALANAGLGAVHGFAAPLGGRFGAAHGAVCAALLPAVWQVNLKAVRERGTAVQMERFRQAAVWLTGDANARAEDGAAWLCELARDLNICGLRSLGAGPDSWDEVIPLARRASSMKANPLALGDMELRRCLELAANV